MITLAPPEPTDESYRLKNKEFLYSIIILLVLVAILFAMGRIPYCAIGDWAIWVTSPSSSHTSQHLLDPYSFTHFEHGLIFILILSLIKRPRLDIALLIEAGWELLENSPYIIDRYRSETMALNYSGDSITNSIGDLLCCALGALIARRVKWQYCVFIMLIIETTLLILMRDNLTTNVIMLIYPIQALKNWQLSQ